MRLFVGLCCLKFGQFAIAFAGRGASGPSAGRDGASSLVADRRPLSTEGASSLLSLQGMDRALVSIFGALFDFFGLLR